MGRLKNLIYRILFFFIDIKNRMRVGHFLRNNHDATMVYFVDIDNTIADTWPSFLKRWPSEADRLNSVTSFKGMNNYLQVLHQKKGSVIIYLTARNFRYESLTKKWLQKNNFPLYNTMLVMVSSPYHKLRYLKMPAKYMVVTFIDDLSYGHEKGIVKKYDAVIAAVKKLPVTYIDVEMIDKLNRQHADIN